MKPALRDGLAVFLLLPGAAVLVYSVVELRSRDYLAAILLIIIGISLMRAGVELVRYSMGE